MSAKEFHIELDEPCSNAATLLAGVSNLSIGRVKQTMQKGAVWLSDKYGTHRLRRNKKIIPETATLHLYYNPDVLDQVIEPPKLIEDHLEYSIWYKPRGVLSQGSKWGDHTTIHRWIETNDPQQRPAIIVHRLDRAASGLMIITHGKKMAVAFTAKFAKRQIYKEYLAVVSGDARQLLSEKIDLPVNDKPAVSRILSTEYDKALDQTRIRIVIETGRKHQVRQHLSAQGFAIIGDRLYGGSTDSDLQLYSVALEFTCPISEQPVSLRLPEGYLAANSAPNTATKTSPPPTQV
ncbi:MAG: tRNA pseudouridine32 synthase/23S rRNA pseudouridine746 synthase [Gammaproteobacteria bacterium]